MINANEEQYIQDINDLITTFKLMNIPSKSFLITGATGLVGSTIIDILIQLNEVHNSNHKIYAVSRKESNLISRFKQFNNKTYMNFIELDISMPFTLAKVYDYIIHAASNADPNQFTQFPVETITGNIIGVHQLLEHSRKSQHTRLIYVSTREVYGEILSKREYQESDFGIIDFNELRANYPESKRVSELLCRSYLAQYNVDCVIARLGYVYGPSMLQTDSRVISQFLTRAITKEEIILKSAGTQKRSYCYSLDAATGILLALFHGTSGQAYNIADQNSEITISGLADLVSKIGKVTIRYEAPSEIETKGYSKPQDALLDTTKMQSLGWKPMTHIKSGIQKTIDNLRSR